MLHTYRQTYRQTDRQTDRTSDEAGLRGAFAPNNIIRYSKLIKKIYFFGAFDYNYTNHGFKQKTTRGKIKLKISINKQEYCKKFILVP